MSRHLNHVALAHAAAAMAVVTSSSANTWAYCPSYTTLAGCAVDPVAGNNPDPATFRGFFDKVGTGSFTAAEGPTLLPITSGCAKPKPETKVPAQFPCHVLYAIAQQESDWTHFCVPESPRSAVGSPERTIVSFDCGYGIAQVTSGMHEGDTPDFDQKRVASDPLYNMATGAQILRSKWQGAECVGDRDPLVVEHWYSALWAYNGNSYSNNPNNPTHSPGRNVYDPENGGSYPYQEKVLGWMEFPKDDRWASILPAYPNRGEIGSGSKPRELSEPTCATPTSCARSRARNLSACTPPAQPQPDAGPPPPPPPPPPPEVDAGAPSVELAAEASAEEGCACAVPGRAPRDAGPRAVWLASFAAIGAVVWRRKRR